jgi:hypothetical protein
MAWRGRRANQCGLTFVCIHTGLNFIRLRHGPAIAIIQRLWRGR